MSESVVGLVSLIVGVLSLVIGWIGAWPTIRGFWSTRASSGERRGRGGAVPQMPEKDLARFVMLCTDTVALTAFAAGQLTVVVVLGFVVLGLGNPEIVAVGGAGGWSEWVRPVVVWAAVAGIGLVSSRLYMTATIVLAYRSDAFISSGPLGRAGDVARQLRAYAGRAEVEGAGRD